MDAEKAGKSGVIVLLELEFLNLFQIYYYKTTSHESFDVKLHLQHLAGGEEVYTSKRLKQKLQDTYGECVFFADLGRGKKEVVCSGIWPVTL